MHRRSETPDVARRGAVAVVQARRIRKEGVFHTDFAGLLVHLRDERLLAARIGAGEHVRGAVVGTHEGHLQKRLARQDHAAAKFRRRARAHVVFARHAKLLVHRKVALGDDERRHELRDRGDRKRHVGVLFIELFARVLIDRVGDAAPEREPVHGLVKSRERSLRRAAAHDAALRLRADGTAFSHRGLLCRRLLHGLLRGDRGERRALGLLRRSVCHLRRVFGGRRKGGNGKKHYPRRTQGESYGSKKRSHEGTADVGLDRKGCSFYAGERGGSPLPFPRRHKYLQNRKTVLSRGRWSPRCARGASRSRAWACEAAAHRETRATPRAATGSPSTADRARRGGRRRP